MSPHPPRHRSALHVALFNATIVVAIGVYLLRGGPLAPDFGLQQLDMLTLREQVPAVRAVEGRPTLYLFAGSLGTPACRRQLAELVQQRGTSRGLPLTVGLVVVTADGTGPPVPAARYQADPDGALARALALPRAAGRCAPGYAIVDGRSDVRYRSYDPRYGEHGLEQAILLEEVQ